MKVEMELSYKERQVRLPLSSKRYNLSPVREN